MGGISSSNSNVQWEHGNRLPLLPCRLPLNSSNSSTAVVAVQVVDNMATLRLSIIIKCTILMPVEHKVTTIRMQPLGCTVARPTAIITRIPSIINRAVVPLVIHREHGAIPFLVLGAIRRLPALVGFRGACTTNNITKEGSNHSLRNNEQRNLFSLQ